MSIFSEPSESSGDEYDLSDPFVNDGPEEPDQSYNLGLRENEEISETRKRKRPALYTPVEQVCSDPEEEPEEPEPEESEDSGEEYQPSEESEESEEESEEPPSKKSKLLYYYETSDPTIMKKCLKQKHLEDCGFGDSILNDSDDEYPERYLFIGKFMSKEFHQDPDLFFYKCEDKNLWIIYTKDFLRKH
jgi:hypothetical protein